MIDATQHEPELGDYDMYTTLNQIKAAHPCRSGWATLMAALGKTEADDELLALTRILQSNGVEDAIWALRACPAAIRKIGEFAQRCADRAKGYAAAARYADAAARYADAAHAAAARYADAAARYADAAADAARYAAAGTADAARYAARYAAAAGTAEREKQKADFIELFGAN